MRTMRPVIRKTPAGVPIAPTPIALPPIALTLIALALVVLAPADGAALTDATGATGATGAEGARSVGLTLPYAAAGLSQRQAAAHALDRLAYGARPGEVDRVLATGLEHWVARQIAGSLPEPRLGTALAGLDALELSGEEIARRYPNPGAVLRRVQRQGGEMGRQTGALARPMAEAAGGAGDQSEEGSDPGDERRARGEMRRLFLEAGYRPPRELDRQLRAQKVLRAVVAENQLHEILTDFWFNHFNVSLEDGQARPYVLSYERDAIRPHLGGDFRTLLGATARHPAMLFYLDNARSRAEAGRDTTLDARRPQRRPQRRSALGRGGRRGGAMGRSVTMGGGGMNPGSMRRNRIGERRQPSQGLNENYARELLELHTLGVDGGYDEADVVTVARAFTGWTALPPEARDEVEDRLPSPTMMRRAGFHFDGLFVFDPRGHDAEAKTVLGHRLPAGRGMEDGEEVLDLLAAHPSTAHHLGHKLAVRFVADEPPTALVERLAATFRATGSDLAAMMVTLVESPEFWASRGEKIKTPLELAASAVRALGAEVVDPGLLVDAVQRMGQPLYAYPAPTGFPDESAFWVNGGALLTRMNFGLLLAADRLPGIRVDLDRLAPEAEPASPREALAAFAAELMPERDPDTVERLQPMLGEPDLAERVESRASATTKPPTPATVATAPAAAQASQASRASSADLRARIVGLVLGSPEFQRR